LALEGHGVERIDGPFPTLGVGRAMCIMCSTLSPLPTNVWIIIPALNMRAQLQRDADKKYRTNVLFNMANVRTLSYHLLIDGTTTSTLTHTITEAERQSGVLTLAN
jgi:hypothetical protein